MCHQPQGSSLKPSSTFISKYTVLLDKEQKLPTISTYSSPKFNTTKIMTEVIAFMDWSDSDSRYKEEKRRVTDKIKKIAAEHGFTHATVQYATSIPDFDISNNQTDLYSSRSATDCSVCM